MTGLWKAWKTSRESEQGGEGNERFPPPSHSPLEIANAIPTFPQPRRRRYSHANQGTFLLPYHRGHFYCLLTAGVRLFEYHVPER